MPHTVTHRTDSRADEKPHARNDSVVQANQEDDAKSNSSCSDNLGVTSSRRTSIAIQPSPKASLLTNAIEDAKSKQLPDLGPWSGHSPPPITAPRELDHRHESILARPVALKSCLKTVALSHEELTDCASEQPFRALRNMLGSAPSAISSPRAFDEVYQDAHWFSDKPFRYIGGSKSCSVWQRTEKESVIKLVSNDQFASALWTEYLALTAIHGGHARYGHLGIDICFPQVYNYFGPKSMCRLPNLEALQQHLGASANPVSDSFTMERVLPVHGLLRTALINHFSRASTSRQVALRALDNKNCLVRIYLGRAKERSGMRPDADRGIDIRDFPLYINDLEGLRVDCHSYARSMGQTLALLHWGCQLDGAGIEFVLGSPRRAHIERQTYSPRQIAGLPPRSTTRLDLPSSGATGVKLWCLDFNSTNKTSFTDNEKDPANSGRIDGLVAALMNNKPYFPRPLSGVTYRGELWKTFSAEYTRVGRAIRDAGARDAGAPDYPGRFIDAVVTAQRAKHGIKIQDTPGPVKVSTAVKALDYALSKLTPTETLDRRLEEGLTMGVEGLALRLGQCELCE